MRKILPLLFALSMLASCGPHRMRCGARGICQSPEKQAVEKPQKTASEKV
ncbi:MAG TPA: hypothetical protein VIH09_02685 [Flavobacterium sp.]